MKDVLLFSELMSLVSVCAIFIILFTTISMVLKQASFFNGKISAVVTLCVSLLGIIGLLRFFRVGDVTYNVSEKSDSQGTNMDIILIPYAALAVAILVMSLLLFLSRIFRKRSKKKHYREFYRGVERSYRLEDMDKPVERNDEERHIQQ